MIVYRRKTAWNDIEVTRDGERLTLWSGRVRQTAVSLAAPGVPLLEPSRGMLLTLAFCPDPERGLVLGLGGGSVPRMLLAAAPGLRLDIVEIDPAMATVARRHFGLRPSRRLRLVLGDAVRHVETALETNAYDLVLVDTYLAGRFPDPLISATSLARLRRCLTPRGVLVINVFDGEGPECHALLQRLAAQFGGTCSLAGRRSRNALLFASAEHLALAAVVARARGLQATLPFPFALEALARRLEPGGSGR